MTATVSQSYTPALYTGSSFSQHHAPNTYGYGPGMYTHSYPPLATTMAPTVLATLGGHYNCVNSQGLMSPNHHPSPQDSPPPSNHRSSISSPPGNTPISPIPASSPSLPPASVRNLNGLPDCHKPPLYGMTSTAVNGLVHQTWQPPPSAPLFNPHPYTTSPAPLSFPPISSHEYTPAPVVTTTSLPFPPLPLWNNYSTPVTQMHKLSYDTPRYKLTPERATPLIRWFDNHKDHPYPSRQDKITLCHETQLTFTQVSTWFANARRRMKKANQEEEDKGSGSEDTTAPASGSESEGD